MTKLYVTVQPYVNRFHRGPRCPLRQKTKSHAWKHGPILLLIGYRAGTVTLPPPKGCFVPKPVPGITQVAYTVRSRPHA